MSKQALLGATGGTGSAVLRCLQEIKDLAQPLYLNILVRSKDKLVQSFPDIEQSTSNVNLNVRVFEADLDNSEVFKDTLRGTDIIYSCIASNTSTPGMTVAVDVATAIIPALKSLQAEQGGEYKTPTVLMLRSLNVNESYAGEDPINKSWNPVILGLKYLYADLDQAGKLLASANAEDPNLLNYIYVDPVSLHDPDGAKCTGYKLSTNDTEMEDIKAVLSYADLGAAYCEIAAKKDQYQGGAVGVSGTGEVRQQWAPLLANIGGGAWNRFKSWS